MIEGGLAAAAWLALRLLAILRAQTLWRLAVGGPSWWAIAGALAIALALMWSPGRSAAVPWALWLVGAGFEVLLGAVLGALVSLPGEAALGAAQQSSRALGLGSSRAFAGLQLALAGALAAALALHRPLLTGLRAVVTRWPVGEPALWMPDLELAAVAAAMHDMSLLALGLATPVLLSAAVVELAVAFGSAFGPLAAPLAPARPVLVAAAAVTALGAAWSVHPEAWLRALPHP